MTNTNGSRAVMLQHLDLKLPLAQDQRLDPELLIPVFHRWVREHLWDELLLDVADYRHVQGGPGVLVIGHYSTFGLDMTDDLPGLRYIRKAPISASPQESLGQAFRMLGRAWRLLQQDDALHGQVRCLPDQAELRIGDRALAPNRPETLQRLRPEFGAFLEQTMGLRELRLEQRGEPRELFTVHVQAPGLLAAIERLALQPA